MAFLGPVPQGNPADLRQAATVALSRVNVAAVDDGSALHVPVTQSVAHRIRYADGRVVNAGLVQTTASFVTRIDPAGTVNGKPWVVLALIPEAVPPPEVPSPAPAGAVDEFDNVSLPDFVDVSLWFERELGVKKAELCDHLDGISPGVRPSADVVCGRPWLAPAGSLYDPDLLLPKGSKGLGFGAVSVGGAFDRHEAGPQAQLGLQFVSSSRQYGWLATWRIEFGGTFPTGFSYGLHGFLGGQVGTDNYGLGVQGGLGLTGVTRGVVPGDVSAVARVQAHAKLGTWDGLLWFEPAWQASSGRQKRALTIPWADEFRAGVWIGGDGSGFRFNGLGVEYQEWMSERSVQLQVGIATAFWALFRSTP